LYLPEVLLVSAEQASSRLQPVLGKWTWTWT